MLQWSGALGLEEKPARKAMIAQMRGKLRPDAPHHRTPLHSLGSERTGLTDILPLDLAAQFMDAGYDIELTEQQIAQPNEKDPARNT